ncbi:RNA polymerase sigma-70 factor [Nonomuraea insulae]|uniref:RNA polymerase sigma-70 factor n=1 Tax=Nonomuraea insulae TaxID=1616787 RepID=A0ABW1D153_9ACTN
MTVDAVEEFERHRSKLFGLAYRMLGSAEEGEDVVQDTFLRWHQASTVESPWAWLAKVATNLCVNRLTSARARRESYVGFWLPEPVLTEGGALGPLDSAEQRELVSLAFLVLLERLNPVERAVFVLREAFDYSHREVAEVIDSSEANSRQLYTRARRRLAEARGGFDRRVDHAYRLDLVESFLAAAEQGDLPGLERVLAEDVTVWVDGGGRVGAARRPISGIARVARYLVGSLSISGQGVRLSAAEVNGTLGLLARAGEELVGVLVPETSDGRISGIRIIANPDKLRLSHSGGLSGSKWVTANAGTRREAVT